MAVQPNGDVTPCVFMPIIFGSLRDKPLKRLWRENDLLGKFRDRSILGGNCGKCDWQLYCGGCRARAYGYFGDVTAADAGCVFNRPAWEQLKRRNGKSVAARISTLKHCEYERISYASFTDSTSF
jgi:radical SAM protein with 4Fe4S-binding SPASM domain